MWVFGIDIGDIASCIVFNEREWRIFVNSIAVLLGNVGSDIGVRVEAVSGVS